jgi:hypothetical protein
VSQGLADLARVVTARRRRGRRDLLWFGSRIGDLDSDSVTDDLTATLYEWAYVRGGPVPLEPRNRAVADRRWTSAAVDPALHAFSSGWRASSSSSVTREGEPMIRLDGATHMRPSGVTLIVPALSREAMPGWLFVRQGDLTTTMNACRLYVNSDPEAVLARLPVLSRVLLDAFPDSFSAKFLTSRDHRDRADSTVVYLPVLPEPALLGQLIEAFSSTVFRTAVPMFTQRVAPGMAVATSPPRGRSFGMEVSASIAINLVAALKAGRDPASGITLPTNPLPGRPRSSDSGAVSRRDHTRPVDPEEALLGLTSRLSAEALTADGQAQWLIRRRSNEFTTMGADVYSGLAGPLLVLAHAVALTGCRGAVPLLHATASSMLARQPELPWAGFHDGQAGVAAALAEAAAIAPNTGLADYARCALDQAIAAVDDDTPSWDVISGIGGTMIALAAASSVLGTDTRDLLDALRLRLAKACKPDAHTGGVRWPGPPRRTRALAGLAHGGTGAGVALLAGTMPVETWAMDLAMRSIAFEDRARTNGADWLDHRMHPIARPATAWCHGSAGIAIGTAAIVTQISTSTEHLAWRTDLQARIATASDRTEHALEDVEFDDGLCHGASGRALSLLVAARSLQQPVDAREILERLSALPRRPALRDFSLMNGDSGRVIAALALAERAAPPLALTMV